MTLQSLDKTNTPILIKVKHIYIMEMAKLLL